jgi:hypothetical protein
MFTVDSPSLIYTNNSLTENVNNKLGLLLSTENTLNILNSLNYSLISSSTSRSNNFENLYFNNSNLKHFYVSNANSELLNWDVLSLLNSVPTTNNGLELEIPKFTPNSGSSIKFN